MGKKKPRHGRPHTKKHTRRKTRFYATTATTACHATRTHALLPVDVDGHERHAVAEGELDEALPDAQHQLGLLRVGVGGVDLLGAARVERHRVAVLQRLRCMFVCLFGACVWGQGGLGREGGRCAWRARQKSSLHGDRRRSSRALPAQPRARLGRSPPPPTIIQTQPVETRTNLGGEGAPGVDGAEEDGHLADGGHPEEGGGRQGLCVGMGGGVVWSG